MSDFSYTVPANTFWAPTKAEANAMALAYAQAHAPDAKFCCELSDVTACEGTSVMESFSITLGESPFTWAITDGSMPNGLTMSFENEGRTMNVSGTPTTPGNASITITITDGTGYSIDQTLNFEITGLADSVIPDATIGVAYSYQLSAIGGSGSNYFELVSGSLPAGLTLSSTGLISGMPTAAGTSNFTIAMTDQATTSPVRGNLAETLEPAWVDAMGSFAEHTFGIQDYTTWINSVVLPAVANYPGSGPIWDGYISSNDQITQTELTYLNNWGNYSGSDPQYTHIGYTTNLPNASMGPLVHIERVTQPHPMWRMFIGCYSRTPSTGPGYIPYAPPYTWLLWQGVYDSDNPSPAGTYVRMDGPINTQELTVEQVT